ncbi:MAG: 50S ribosomal protein L35 [Bryobacteraceae bacterium]|jgi:large subunit ribosomal protein L35|nr:50S ribosomal protein L35 [Bryobacteraceae bacterium]
MPKLKTHKGAVKRFKRTGSGKLMRRHSFARHLLTGKSRARKRRLKKPAEVAPGDATRIANMLPYSP